MRTVILDGEKIQDRCSLHEELSQLFSFPDWYGGNLDALFDCLTEAREETLLTVSNREALEERLGDYAKGFFRVLNAAAEENPFFTLREETT